MDSTEQNPTHEFTEAGVYTVHLAVTGLGSFDELTKTGYIVVSESEKSLLTTARPAHQQAEPGLFPAEQIPLEPIPSMPERQICITPGHLHLSRAVHTRFISGGRNLLTRLVDSGRNYPQSGNHNLTVNQQTDGGRWNSLGKYVMNAGESYRVRIIRQVIIRLPQQTLYALCEFPIN